MKFSGTSFVNNRTCQSLFAVREINKPESDPEAVAHAAEPVRSTGMVAGTAFLPEAHHSRCVRSTKTDVGVRSKDEGHTVDTAFL